MINKAFGRLLILAAIILIAVFFIPWRLVDWGKISLMPASTVTVTGEAKTQQRTEIAEFTAGVSSVQDDKEAAINEVNSKMETIIASVKQFGIEDKDIKTENLSVHQQEERYYEEGRQKTRPGQWRVSNSISVKLRNVDRASDLADLLTRSGATNVYGPRLMVDDTSETEEGLLEVAIEDARSKAETIAKAGSRRLGKIISVQEGGGSSRIYPIALEGMGGGGAPIEPGSSTVYKTVTVVFELK